MRKPSLIMLAMWTSLACSRRMHDSADGGSAGTGGGHAGTGVTSAGGSTGSAGSTGGGATPAGGAGIGGGAAATGGAGATGVGGGGIGGGAAAAGGAGTGGGAAAAGGAGTGGGAAAAGGGGIGGSGPTGGTGGAAGSGSDLPRFVVIGRVDPSGSPRASRWYSIVLNGASDDGSVLVGSSTFTDTATSTTGGVNFYWTEASGVVRLVPPSTPPRKPDPWPHVSPDGTAIFGLYDGGVYRWTKQAGYEFFALSWPPGELAFSRDGTVAWGWSFRWRPGDGLVSFSMLPAWSANGYPNLRLCGSCSGLDTASSEFSDDGKIVAGSYQPSSAPGPQLVPGFIWSEPGTFVELGPMPGTSACWVGALSRDGTTAFGGCAQDPSSQPMAFRWTAATGMVPIGPTGDDLYYTDTTRDGRVAMGRNGINTLARWTADAGAVRLQPSSNTIDPARYSLGMTVGSLSDDGGAIYGRATRTDFQPGFEEERPEDAFRWSVADGFVLLSPLPGHDIATINAAARDGSVHVGVSRMRRGNPGDVAQKTVVWDCRGIRDIEAELAAGGINLQGGGLVDVVRVWSGASIMIVGYGVVSGVACAWIAWLPRRC